ncbi:MAG: hypothetical protein NT076_02135 [Candidatus Pacearchaeota archaeon]|nr:hypothetical protein [Candidatus Pacearchaeota archaeon]
MVQGLEEELQEFDTEMGGKTHFSLKDIKRIITADIPKGKLRRRHFIPGAGFPLYFAEDLASRIIRKLLKKSDNYNCLDTARDTVTMREAQFFIGPLASCCFLLGYKIYPLLF